MDLLNSLSNLLLVLGGFTFIIFIHELGHFIAAKWAGIRVLAFAIGFGPSIVSFRKGLGFRRGSSEAEYARLKQASQSLPAISPTEYRVNWLPFGGYVKMLGQEDANPGAISDEHDSYQNCAPWKRMIVISAGVVSNIILAALIFMLVFMVGIQNPPAKAGAISTNSPAANAFAANAKELGITTPGIQAGDMILSINGREMSSYLDILPEVALSNKDELLDIRIRRPGVAQPLRFNVKPLPMKYNGILDIGVGPPQTTTLLISKHIKERDQIQSRLDAAGFAGIRPGMELVSISGNLVKTPEDIQSVVDASQGNPILFTFSDSLGELSRAVKPRVRLEDSWVQAGKPEDLVPVGHLLGLAPVMKVGSTTARGGEQGLRANDVFIRLGDAEHPSILDGIRQIRAHAGKSIEVVVNRRAGDAWKEVAFKAQVDSQGQIGFTPSDTREDSSIAALSLKSIKQDRDDKDWTTPSASSLITSPGSRIVEVNGESTISFRDVRAAILKTHLDSAGNGILRVTLQPPATAAGEIAHEVKSACNLSIADLDTLRTATMGWESPLGVDLFKLEEVLMKARSPGEAVRKGISETRRWMLSVYVTFLRLYQGSVPVNQLHGPVGIATVGTSIADKGLMNLLLFMAMISVNLAVVNFLPLPIVDGGQFLFLLWEQLRGKPASLRFQNAATLAGIVLIGAMFLFVTFNDIATLFRR